MLWSFKRVVKLPIFFFHSDFDDTWSSTLVLLVLCLIFEHFERPIGIVALSVNHMIRNLDGALVFLFSSVSVEISL
jgi:hypothetical protein